jgi:hypothetical protein
MSGGTQNRRSPSGFLTDAVFSEFVGTNVLPAADAIEYIALGSPGTEGTESDAQLTPPEQGLLLALAIENFVLGDAADLVTYRMKKNGAVIVRPDGTPAEVVVPSNAAIAVMQINVDIQGALITTPPPPGPPIQFKAADLLSIEVEMPSAPLGTSPKVRTTLLWTPGRVERFQPAP